MLYELRNLKKEFGSRTVLDIASLALEARKVYALIGPNGAGKTTLLNHLAFLEQPTSGVLRFRNEEIPVDDSHLVNLRRRVVMVDQSPILFSGTVWKNVEFGLRVRGVPKKERAVRIAAALERVGMFHFASTDAHGLSGGEVKRVALARALVLEPDFESAAANFSFRALQAPLRMTFQSLSAVRKFGRISGGSKGLPLARSTVPRLSGCSITIRQAKPS